MDGNHHSHEHGEKGAHEGKGKNGGGSKGPGGFCACHACGTRVEHMQGVKCTTLHCPNCGHKMIREELLKK